MGLLHFRISARLVGTGYGLNLTEDELHRRLIRPWLAGDLVVASDRARFSEIFVQRGIAIGLLEAGAPAVVACLDVVADGDVLNVRFNV